MKYVKPNLEVLSMPAQDIMTVSVTFSYEKEGYASSDVLDFNDLVLK